jgi:methylmalonyl-CoA mutase
MSSKKRDLFAEFDATATAEWEAAIVKSLKGKDYDDTLIWKTIEGIDVRPYYRSDDVEHPSSLPGQKPFDRGTRTGDNKWEIRADIAGDNLVNANKTVLTALANGANNIAFQTPISNPEGLDILLHDVMLELINVQFAADHHVLDLHQWFCDMLRARGLKSDQIRGAYAYDPIGNLVKTGNWYDDKNGDFSRATDLLDALEDFSPLFRGLEVNAELYHNAGASIVQELGCALAHGNEYLAQLTGAGQSVDTISGHLQFSYAVGSHYFLEIAKLRAARMLWSRIVEQYDPAHECSHATYVHATTSKWNKAVYDAHTNMLRSTTEAMSAALGAVNSLAVTPFNSSYEEPDAFASRISQNVQLVLQEESYLDKIVDPAAGSYYIETLTDKIAEKAWAFFQEIEKRGGLLACLQVGFIQEQIAETAAEKQRRFESGELVVLGVNKHPNPENRMSDHIKINPTEAVTGHTAINPLPQYRLTAQRDEERLESERTHV